MQSELEGVGKEIEDDFLPHIAIDEHGFRERVAGDGETHAGTFNGRAKDSGDFGGEGSQVGWLVGGFHAAGFDAREIEEGVDQFEETKAVAMDELQLLLIRRRWQAGVAGEHVRHRTKHESQRSAKFMTDVTEECGLGAIKFSESFGALTFGLVAAGIGERIGDLANEKVVEGAVVGVETLARADGSQENSGGKILAGKLDGKGQGRLRACAPRSQGQIRTETLQVRDLGGEARFERRGDDVEENRVRTIGIEGQ